MLTLLDVATLYATPIVHAGTQRWDRLKEVPPGSTVVTIVRDGGERYLDTVFNDEWIQAKEVHSPDTETAVWRLLDEYDRAAARPIATGARK